MSVDFVKGSLLDADLDYYCHQVNCQGRMRSGIAKAIRDKWPKVYDKYMELYHQYLTKPHGPAPLLGTIQIVDIGDKCIINMFAQQFYGYDGKRYTSYDAFWSCLGQIRDHLPKGSKIGFPDHIGCGLGGADWEVIRKMIEVVLGWDYIVYIYKLEE